MSAEAVMLGLLGVGVLAVLVAAWMQSRREGTPPPRKDAGTNAKEGDPPAIDPDALDSREKRDDSHMFNRIIK